MDSVERLVNLTLYLADARGSVTAEQVRSDVAGYPADQDDATFKRMLERDKDHLRQAGLVIDSDAEGNYNLDAAATYVAPVELSAKEAAAVRAAATALLDDPSFPFVNDLRLALAKISAEVGTGSVASSTSLADEHPAQQGEAVATLTDAATRRKRISFGYTNSFGAAAVHAVEPYGLFLHDGRWYVVGRDSDRDEVRTYAVARMTALNVESKAPKSPDFERPADFDIATFVRLPFQYGSPAEEFEAVLAFDATAAPRMERVAAGKGRLERVADRVLWHVPARSARWLMRFVVEQGPGISLVAPAEIVDELRNSLTRAEAAHG